MSLCSKHIISSFNRQESCTEIAFPCFKAYMFLPVCERQNSVQREKAPNNNRTKKQNNLLLFGQNAVLPLLFY